MRSTPPRALCLTLLQGAFNNTIRALRDPICSSVRDVSANGRHGNWRLNNFHPPAGGGEFGSGCLNLSPGWFQQGHEVCLFVALQHQLSNTEPLHS